MSLTVRFYLRARSTRVYMRLEGRCGSYRRSMSAPVQPDELCVDPADLDSAARPALPSSDLTSKQTRETTVKHRQKLGIACDAAIGEQYSLAPFSSPSGAWSKSWGNRGPHTTSEYLRDTTTNRSFVMTQHIAGETRTGVANAARGQ